MSEAAKGPWGAVGVCWGILGLTFSLGEATWRLTPLALEPLTAGMRTWEWVLYVGFAVLNAYAEGYRGFQLRFAPRVAARARALWRGPTVLRVVLAPLFLMALVDASRRRRVASWSLVTGIALVVWAVRHLDQPYRGIVDAGVVIGLTWGMLSIAWELVRVARGLAPRADPELAGEPSAKPAGARGVQNT